MPSVRRRDFLAQPTSEHGVPSAPAETIRRGRARPEAEANSAEPAIAGIDVHSGQVMTVLGPIPVEDLGVTLTHEHILSDVGCNGPEPQEASRKHLFNRPLTMDVPGEVRALP